MKSSALPLSCIFLLITSSGCFKPRERFSGGGTGGTAGSETGGVPAGGAAGGGSGGSMSTGGYGGAIGGSAGASTAGVSGSSTGGVAGSGGQDAGFCDGTALPENEPCVIEERYGVFVSPTGSADGDGSRSNPLRSLNDALLLAAQTERRVYACSTSGGFEENIQATSATDGVELFGGFDCASWQPIGSAQTLVAPPSGYALEVDGLLSGITLRDFELRAKDQLLPNSGHSIAVWIRNSDGVHFTRTTVAAGAGADGMAGETPNEQYPDPATLHGNPGGTTTRGDDKVCTCPGGDQTMGAGGGIPFAGALDGADGLPNLGAGQGGVGGTTCVQGGFGTNGANGADGVEGEGADSVAALEPSNLLGTPGEAGSRGEIGQGGGGGAASLDAGGAGGGSGGCGTCAGAGGGGGKPGGSSVGLVAIMSNVTLTNCEISAERGGDGGDGAVGQTRMIGIPEFPDYGGVGAPGGISGCGGGAGGLGGNGGPGGGGAGGISTAILFRGAAPTVNSVTMTPSQAGDGGRGAGMSNDGVRGISAPLLDADTL